MQIITFTSVRLYCLITLICLIILISHILQLFLIQKFIVSVQVRIFPLNTCDLMIYIARWWEKYLSKRGIIKHTCSRRNKLIVLWTLNRQMKIFLRIRVNNAFNNLLWKVFNKLFNDIQVHSLCLVVLYLLMFKVSGILGSPKIVVFNFSRTESVKQNQEKLKTIQNLLSL